MADDRRCGHCGLRKPVTDFYANRSRPDGLSNSCKDCDRARRRAFYHRDIEASRERGRAEYAANPAPRLATARRYREQHHEKHLAAIKAQRAKQRGCDVVEVFASREILDRDEWRCGICGDRIDESFSWPHPLSPSVDHVVPLAARGEHSRANAQAAHLGCNWRKHTGTGAGLKNVEMARG